MERFVTDNPFRILAVGSELGYQALRRAADGAARAASVGLEREIPLLARFGTIEFEELTSSVRSLARDRVKRCAFRLTWPLTEAGIPYVVERKGGVTTALPAEEADQVLFLSAWFSFLKAGEPRDAEEALARLSRLATKEAMTSRLAKVLMDEDGISEDEARKTLAEADQMVARALLSRVASAAADHWTTGEMDRAVELATVVLDSPLDDDLEEVSLEPLIDTGTRLNEEVEAMIRDMPDWHHGDPVSPPSLLNPLKRLGDLFAPRHPIAKTWQETYDNWNLALVWEMRAEALRLNQADRDAEAFEVIRQAIQTSTDPEQRARLVDDAAALQEVLNQVRNHHQSDPDIKPVVKAPELATINGMGFVLYGSKPYKRDLRLSFSVLYFTLLFIPIFPIRRYLVQKVDHNRWQFHGTTPWTNWMVAHLVVSLGVILGLLMALNQDSINAAAESNSASAPITSTSDTPVDPPPATTPSPLPEKKLSELSRGAVSIDKKGRVRSQMRKLDEKINDLNMELSGQEMSITVERTGVELAKPFALHSIGGPTQAEADEYNRKVRDYEKKRRAFNRRVDVYNGKVRKLKQMNADYKKLEKQLKAMK